MESSTLEQYSELVTDTQGMVDYFIDEKKLARDEGCTKLTWFDKQIELWNKESDWAKKVYEKAKSGVLTI